MKYLLSLVLALTAVANGFAQIQPLQIGQIHTIKSTVLAENRTLNIYLPQDYDSTKAYPVIYVLDGSINEDFVHIVGLVQFFNLQAAMPQHIIVGIANVDRKRDFTFPTDLADLKEKYPTTGKSAAFISFIQSELLPYIQQNFKTNGTKMLIGQSLGGLLASEIFITMPNLFTHYFIVSPSLWWDNESLLKAAPDLITLQKANTDITIFVSVGGKEPKIMKGEAKGLAKAIKSARAENYKLYEVPMPKETHASILHLSIYECLNILYPMP